MSIDISLAGRVALVTGASRGIGRTIALQLTQAGADVAINYRRDEAAARETVAAITALGRQARAYAAAVEDREQAQRMTTDVLGRFRRGAHPGQQRRHQQPRAEGGRH